MSTRKEPGHAQREEMLRAVFEAGRRQSDATVLFHSAVAARMGLGPTDSKTLSVLERLGPMTAGALARHTGLATASVTHLVDRLEEKGFVRRVRDAKDRRSVRVEIRPEKLHAHRGLFEGFGRSLGRLLEEYSTEELRVIAHFLERTAVLLRDAAEEVQAARD